MIKCLINLFYPEANVTRAAHVVGFMKMNRLIAGRIVVLEQFNKQSGVWNFKKTDRYIDVLRFFQKPCRS